MRMERMEESMGMRTVEIDGGEDNGGRRESGWTRRL